MRANASKNGFFVLCRQKDWINSLRNGLAIWSGYDQFLDVRWWSIHRRLQNEGLPFGAPWTFPQFLCACQFSACLSIPCAEPRDPDRAPGGGVVRTDRPLGGGWPGTPAQCGSVSRPPAAGDREKKQGTERPVVAMWDLPVGTVLRC